MFVVIFFKLEQLSKDGYDVFHAPFRVYTQLHRIFVRCTNNSFPI